MWVFLDRWLIQGVGCGDLDSAMVAQSTDQVSGLKIDHLEGIGVVPFRWDTGRQLLDATLFGL